MERVLQCPAVMGMLRFGLEKTCISAGRGYGRSAEDEVSVVVEAPNVESAITAFVERDHSQLVGEVLRFEKESLATVTKGDLLYLLRLYAADVA